MHTDDFVDGRSVGGWRLKLLGDEEDDWDEVTTFVDVNIIIFSMWFLCSMTRAWRGMQQLATSPARHMGGAGEAAGCWLELEIIFAKIEVLQSQRRSLALSWGWKCPLLS